MQNCSIFLFLQNSSAHKGLIEMSIVRLRNVYSSGIHPTGLTLYGIVENRNMAKVECLCPEFTDRFEFWWVSR